MKQQSPRAVRLLSSPFIQFSKIYPKCFGLRRLGSGPQWDCIRRLRVRDGAGLRWCAVILVERSHSPVRVECIQVEERLVSAERSHGPSEVRAQLLVLYGNCARPRSCSAERR